MSMPLKALGIGLFLTSFVFAETADWRQGVEIPPGGRANPYNLAPDELRANIERGRLHALWYPVEVTGLLVPYNAFVNFLDAADDDPFKRLVKSFFKNISNFHSTDQVLQWLGLQPYPQKEDTGIYSVPYPTGESRPTYRMGFTKIRRFGADGFTFSCAACHSGELFGKRVLGMTNRFTRANEFFIKGKQGAALAQSHFFKYATKATKEEMEMMAELKRNVRAVGLRKPVALGLDTSLGQVAVSLAHRNKDAYATKSRWYERFPRDELLRHVASDSKPAVWWNLKYKNRWLSDGAILSGNPVYTNFIWNEIGRGVDLKELEDWLARNDQTVQELTTAVFSTQAPRYTDFFAAAKISIEQAKRGEKVYLNACAKCHGVYEKAWSQANAASLTDVQKLETTLVRYHSKTPVVNVGTDPSRRQGMDSLAAGLNPLSISQRNGIVITEQRGYIPPPLVGIWARWPYFHNNSVPSLCAVLTPAPKRPRTYWAGEAKNPETDFDSVCNGYPQGDAVPVAWKKNPDAFYDTNREGMSNSGHDNGIFVKNGKETLTHDEKMAVIEYLKTL